MVYSFKPEVEETLTHLKGEKALEKPLYQRIPELMKTKNETLQRMRFEVEEDKKLTFQPEINPKVRIFYIFLKFAKIMKFFYFYII